MPPTQVSTLPSALLLAATGGLLDAVVFLSHGHVFANAMTGNVVFLGISVATRDWSHLFTYLIPILAFLLGVFASHLLQNIPSCASPAAAASSLSASSPSASSSAQSSEPPPSPPRQPRPPPRRTPPPRRHPPHHPSATHPIRHPPPVSITSLESNICATTPLKRRYLANRYKAKSFIFIFFRQF